MAVCTETWLVADHEALRSVFGPKLDVTKLPPANRALEEVEKEKVSAALAQATKTTKATYEKGQQQFKVLALVSPDKLRMMSWAKRFLDAMSASNSSAAAIAAKPTGHWRSRTLQRLTAQSRSTRAPKAMTFASRPCRSPSIRTSTRASKRRIGCGLR